MAATTTILSLAGQATADILVADSFCVHKMGRVPGASSLVLVSALLYRSRRRFCRRCRNIPPPPIDNSCSSGVGGGGGQLFWRMMRTTTMASGFIPLFLIRLAVAYALLNSDPMTKTTTDHHHSLTSPGIYLPKILEGFYYYNGTNCDYSSPSFPSSNCDSNSNPIQLGGGAAETTAAMLATATEDSARGICCSLMPFW